MGQHWTSIGSTRHELAGSVDKPHCVSQPSKHEALNQCWFDAGQASQTVGQHWTSIGSTRLELAGSVDKPHCVVPKRNNKFRLIQNLKPLRVVHDSYCKMTFQCEDIKIVAQLIEPTYDLVTVDIKKRVP